MSILPVIVGFGGINCAGRSSGFHSYKRILSEVLTESQIISTWRDLGHRMGILKPGQAINQQAITAIKQGTLIRKIENFDVEKMVCHHKAKLVSADTSISIVIQKSKIPSIIPEHWQIQELENHEVKITLNQEELSILLPDKIPSAVSSGANIPTGFDPGKLYNSHHHPRGLKLTIYGISDALNSLGMEWSDILSRIKPDEVTVYAGSALGQIDEYSLAGLIGQPLSGNRINSKMIALSLAEMPADFINSYVLNSVGPTGTNMGACATFLYNLRQGIYDIQTKRAKVVIVGNVETPIAPEIIEGFRAMGALATDEALCALDNSDRVDHRRACRPFSTNAGFTVAEASQFVILMNDQLALELGANIYGSVADIFISADANKRSISKPGIGNYITMAKATALAKAILGADNLDKTYVQAHGTGTPQNRSSESHILNEIAKTFGIKSWPVAAIKAYLGHSMSAAGGDQLVNSLGVWQYGWIPGIKTIDHLAHDIYCSHLNILMDHMDVGGSTGLDIHAAIINSKGFGGNNASGLILSPHKTMEMLKHRHGEKALKNYYQRNEIIAAKRDEIDQKTCEGDERIIYNFGENVMDETSVSITQDKISLSEFSNAIHLPLDHPFKEYFPNIVNTPFVETF